MTILNALWFSSVGNPDPVGIVIGRDDVGKLRCYIGIAKDSKGVEKNDMQYVATNGTQFPLDAAKILFPEEFKDFNWGKKSS